MVRAYRFSVHGLLVILAMVLAACGNTVPSNPQPNSNPPRISALTLNPASVTGGQNTTATLTLTSAAAAGGSLVGVSANNLSLTIPRTVMVLAGATTATFKIVTPQVGSTLILAVNASLNNSTMQATLTITPTTVLSVASLTINPTSVPSGNTTSATVTLSAPAFAAGQPVNMTSSSPLVVVPSPVVVGPGLTSVTFSVFTSAVTAPTSVDITAELNGMTQPATLMLTLPPPLLRNLSLQPNPVVGGMTTTGTLTLDQPAGMGIPRPPCPQVPGVCITLASSDKVTAPVPTTPVVIPAGATQVQFMIKPIVVTTQHSPLITATQNSGTLNAVTQAVTLNIVTAAVTVTSISVNPATTTGGLQTNGLVILSAAAPQGGTTVQLSSSNTTAATVPPSVVVLSGSTFARFPVMTSAVATTQMATLTATLGSSTQTTTLTVDAASALTVSTLTLSPATVVAGQTSTGTVTISGFAQPGGTTVMLTSSDPLISFLPSASLVVTAGATTQTFTATTTTGMPATATITATLNGSQQMAMLSAVPPPTLVSVTLALTTLVGGLNTSGTLTISAAAPGGTTTTVTVTSNDVHVQVPATVTIPAGSTSAIFAVTTLAVTSPNTVTITANLGGSIQMATLMLTPPPPTLTEVFFNPPTIAAGQSSTGTVVLNALAPAGGTSVTLSLPTGTTAVTLPAGTTVMVAAGTSMATFTANAAATVTTQTVVQVTATLTPSTQMNSLTVIPAQAATLSEQIVVGGETTSADFPVIPNPGAFQTTLTGADSGTLTNINLMTPAGGSTTSSGSFSTFFGNSNLGQVRDVFVDSAGNVFACGVTSDSALPTSASGVVQRTYGGGNSDAFVAEFDSTGQVKFLTYLGGTGDDSCNNIFVNAAGNIFISGRSNSTNLVGPATTPAVIQTNFAGGTGSDFFVAELAPNAASAMWLTFLGGMSDDQASGRITVDSMGNVYVSGKSQSTLDFPIASTQGRPNMIGAATFGVVVKLNSTGAQLTYSAFLFGRVAPSGVSGGTVSDASGGVAVNSSGIAYVCGAASATDFPTTTGAFQTTLKGTQNAYVARLSSNGTITALTLLGGTSTSAVQACKGIAIDSEGNIIVVTPTDASDYPTSGPGLGPLGGPSDFAVTKLTADLTTVIFSRLVGGSGAESADATRVELDASENIYFSLATNSGDLPGMAVNSFQQIFKGVAGGTNNNMAIIKLSADGSTILYGTYLGGSMQNSTITLRYHHN